MSKLHAKIMNIQCIDPGWCRSDEATAYRLGHRDARHAAAELAAMNTDRIEALEADRDAWRNAYQALADITTSGGLRHSTDDQDRRLQKARKAIRAISRKGAK